MLTVFLHSVLQLIITANVVPSSLHPDDGGDSSSETSVLTKATPHNIPEDGILLILILFKNSFRNHLTISRTEKRL
jgi:hypothetical protein